MAQLQIGPKKFTEVSEVKVPPQSPINLLKTLVEGACRGEKERERKRRAQHTLLAGGASLRSQLFLAGGAAKRLALRSQITQPLNTTVALAIPLGLLPFATTC